MFFSFKGYGDLAFDVFAYILGLASVVTQAVYLLLVQKCAENVSAAETLHLNSYNTFPMLLICSVISGEFRHAVSNFALSDVGFLLTFISVIVFGCLLNYLLFLCTTYNSALTTSVAGTLKSIIQTLIGMFTFGGISFNVFTLSGIALNLSGGVLYTLVKYKSSQQVVPVNGKGDLENGEVCNGVARTCNGTTLHPSKAEIHQHNVAGR